jgi:hypothetical protein
MRQARCRPNVATLALSPNSSLRTNAGDQPKLCKFHRDSIRTDDRSTRQLPFQQPPSSPNPSHNRRDGAGTFRNRGRSEQGPRTLNPSPVILRKESFRSVFVQSISRGSIEDTEHEMEGTYCRIVKFLDREEIERQRTHQLNLRDPT